jgi:hypothetical protein
VNKNNSKYLHFIYAGGDKVNKKILVIALALFALPLVTVMPVSALGPTNAGGEPHEYSPANWMSYNYVGVDYGAGWTPTTCGDGTEIGPIGSEANPATLLAKGRYFSETEWTDKDWVYYKFWLDGQTVDITFPDTSTYTATKFIVITLSFETFEYTLEAYK